MTQLLVDGTNLLHAMTRGPGIASRRPPLIGRLRGAIPTETRITLVFDGPPERSIRGERIAGGLTVQFSGRRRADEDPPRRSSRTPRPGPRRWRRGERPRRNRRSGPAVRRSTSAAAAAPASAWLIGRLDRPRLDRPSDRQLPPAEAAAGSPSRRRRGDGDDATSDDEARPWRPDRGATTKRGNPRRAPKSARRSLT